MLCNLFQSLGRRIPMGRMANKKMMSSSAVPENTGLKDVQVFFQPLIQDSGLADQYGPGTII